MGFRDEDIYSDASTRREEDEAVPASEQNTFRFGPDVYARVLEAKDPWDLFGAWGDDEEAVNKAYRRFRWVHPDRAEDDQKDIATEAFARLGQLREQALAQIAGGRYGATPPWTVTTRRGSEYELAPEPEWSGDSCDIFLGERAGERVFVKLARSPADADLMQNEAKRIRQVLGGDDKDLAAPYMPGYIESFQVTVDGKRLRANAFQRRSPELVPLTVIREHWTKGVPPKHVAWMFRRMLTALGCIHNQGLVHGAFVPDHLLIHPMQHGLVPIDWRACVEEGEALSIMASGYANWYPESVLNKEPARAELDINFAALSAMYAAGDLDNLPRQFRAFLKGCRANRLPHAWELKDEFDQLIEGMWGPRVYRPFTLDPRDMPLSPAGKQ